MSREARWQQRALHDLRALDRETARRIGRAVERYAETGHGDAKKLEGRHGEYRLRIGTWRVIFSYGTNPETDAPTIDLLRVLARRDAYRG